MNVVTDRPYPTYPDGFPPELLDAFTEATGYGVLGNKPASGTQIIQELGDEHVSTGKLIVYTSADSVFQIAAHEDIVPLEELYRVCEIARSLLKPPHEVSRVIARPFVGGDGDYLRTPNRRDFSVKPPENLLLNQLRKRGVKIHAVGKIFDLYAGSGIHRKYKSKSNAQGMKVLKRVYGDETDEPALFLLNLVDFDMLWGHRNDPKGMAGDLEAFDEWLGGFLQDMRADDLLLITADHGNDPTTTSTDHSREYVPILAVRGGRTLGNDLGDRTTFADMGATLADYFGIPAPPVGTSFLDQVGGVSATVGVNEADRDRLLDAARDVLQRSYSPYSHFRVGAALMDDHGRIHTGTNVENASFGLSICAERAAVCKAVSEGAGDLFAGAVVSESRVPTPPCGACRQVLFEIAPDMPLYLAGSGSDIEMFRVRDLMPRPFATFESEGES